MALATLFRHNLFEGNAIFLKLIFKVFILNTLYV